MLNSTLNVRKYTKATKRTPLNHILYLILFLLLFSSCLHAQTNVTNENITINIKNDLIKLLPNGAVKTDIIDGVRQDPRQMELSKKLQTSIRQNYEWFVDYMKTIPSGQKMPYHTKLGVTKAEYTELLNFMDNIEIISTGTETISIQNKNDIIHFKSQNKLSALDSLTIDLKNNIVLFGQIKIPFANAVNITTDNNGLRSKWKGYSWILEEPKDLDVNTMKNLSSLKMRQYKFTIGKLEKNGKTYMSLKGREIESGTKTVDFELPVQF